MALDPSRKENKDMSLEKNTTKTYPDYIRHWEVAKPWGWEIRIATKSGLHVIHCKWKDYKRPGLLKEEKDV